MAADGIVVIVTKCQHCGAPICAMGAKLTRADLRCKRCGK